MAEDKQQFKKRNFIIPIAIVIIVLINTYLIYYLYL